MLIRKKNEGELSVLITRHDYMALIEHLYKAQQWYYEHGDYEAGDSVGYTADTMWIEYLSIYGR